MDKTNEKKYYKPLSQYNDEEIINIIKNGAIEEIIVLPLSVGFYCTNWKFAQNICVELCNYDDERVRCNCALGFGYIAKTQGKLEKHIVKPLLLKLLREKTETELSKDQVITGIKLVNLFLGWNIGKKEIAALKYNL